MLETQSWLVKDTGQTPQQLQQRRAKQRKEEGEKRAEGVRPIILEQIQAPPLKSRERADAQPVHVLQETKVIYN